MTELDKELLMRMSMLMDAELDGRDNPRLIDAIESHVELRARWARYSQIGDVIRSSASGQLADKDFAAKVSAVVAQEPAILVSYGLKLPRNRRPGMVTMALAASLAIVAVIVGKSVNDHAEVFHTLAHNQSVSAQMAAKYTDQADSQFNDYLVMHNETAYMAGSAAMLPYVRVAGSSPGR